MKKGKLICLLLFAVVFMFSCNRKNNNDIENFKSREYITETGFENEKIENENNLVYETTEKFDIIHHPEMWNPTDKNTFIHLINCLFIPLSKENVIDSYDNRLLITDNLKKNCDFDKFCLGFVDMIYSTDADKSSEVEVKALYTDEQFSNHNFEIKTSNGEIDRTHTFEFEIRDGKLDNIKLISSIVLGVENDHNNDYENYEDATDEEIKIDNISKLVSAGLDEFNTWKIYGLFTDNFIGKFNAELGLINGLDQYEVADVTSNKFTDVNNNCVGITITLRDNSKKNYIVYYAVDNNKYIDAIIKLEEVLEDGTTVEIENNFGK